MESWNGGCRWWIDKGAGTRANGRRRKVKAMNRHTTTVVTLELETSEGLMATIHTH